jgi:nucleotide-binding universal stress UspA family protein
VTEPDDWQPQCIIVACDDSRTAQRALLCAIRLARTFGSRLCAVAVQPRLPRGAATVGEVEDVLNAGLRTTRRVLSTARAFADEEGVEVVEQTRFGYMAREVVQAAGETHADLAVIGGARDRGTARWRLWPTTEQAVAKHAPCPVLIVR